MGVYDGADVCELVVLYILKERGKMLTTPVDFTDDGLAYMENVKELNADKMRKGLIKISKTQVAT